MGIGIINDSDNDISCMYCTTTMYAFGPTFEYFDELKTAESFLEWMTDNRNYVRIRMLTDDELSVYVNEWNNRYIEKSHIPFNEVTGVELDGIDKDDYPDFVDSYAIYAEWPDGKKLTENELESLTDQNPDEIQGAARMQYIGA